MSAGQKGPPSAQVLATLHAARDERNLFVESLPPLQKEEVLRLLEVEKHERKAMLKAAAQESGATSKQSNQTISSEAARIKEKQKEVMRQAFWLYQQDRQKEEGTQYVDSTEWKSIRAQGGEHPTLRYYIKLAGWDESWPLPEPEGRAYRREQHAKGKLRC